jgi:hypothetical protein
MRSWKPAAPFPANAKTAGNALTAARQRPLQAGRLIRPNIVIFALMFTAV